MYIYNYFIILLGVCVSYDTRYRKIKNRLMIRFMIWQQWFYLCKIRIHPYPFIQGHHGLSIIFNHIGLGLLTNFCFLFSLFIWFCWASLIGLYSISPPLGYSNSHFTHQEGPLITHLPKGAYGPTLGFILYSQHYYFKKTFY